MRALLLLALASPALAQTGATSLPATGPKPQAVPDWMPAQFGLPSLVADAPGAPHYLFTKNGQCVWWYVYGDTIGQRVYCGTVADLPNVGSRVNTIRKAADPLASLNTLPQRITMATIVCKGLVCSTTDAALQPIVADLNAARGK